MLLFIIGLVLIGLVAGAVARAVVPGPDPMGIGGTILLGIVGSFIGGFLIRLAMGADGDAFAPAGLLGSIVGAVIALLVYRAVIDRGDRRRTA